jgi:AcrR family transcriptional regulator
MGRPSTREKLLDCAEHLFAEHGLEGVSLRTINSEAGLSPAALHYHFGSKAALLEAILERTMPPLMERRRLLLDELSASESVPTTREVLNALIRPLVDLLARGDASGPTYLRLIHRLQADRDLDQQFVIERWPGGVDRLLPLLRDANPGIPLPVIQFRLELVIEAMLRSLSREHSPDQGDLESHLSSLLDFLTAGFEASIDGERQP